MDIEAIFEFVADNPPMGMIAGGILLIVLSVLTVLFDPNTTGFLRTVGLSLIGLGFILQVLWLYLRNR
jgi:hypothetical protein